ncbi:MAG: zinc ribbon domain-containing protein [Methanobrevibacter sp.]|nr:zinc ribbon domain-containing protein [Methanobrevibacter sp.]MDO5848803.1 zinc ribbon domain-containing protein [Methanobrevibacter sp.]
MCYDDSEEDFICPICGEFIESGEVICPFCGTPL